MADETHLVVLVWGPDAPTRDGDEVDTMVELRDRRAWVRAATPFLEEAARRRRAVDMALVLPCEGWGAVA
jgi:hypothetical protein